MHKRKNRWRSGEGKRRAICCSGAKLSLSLRRKKGRKVAKLKCFKNFKFVLRFKKLFEPAKKVETDAADTKSIQCDFRGLEPTKYEINLKLLLLQFVTLHSASLNLISTTSNH